MHMNRNTCMQHIHAYSMHTHTNGHHIEQHRQKHTQHSCEHKQHQQPHPVPLSDWSGLRATTVKYIDVIQNGPLQQLGSDTQSAQKWTQLLHLGTDELAGPQSYCSRWYRHMHAHTLWIFQPRARRFSLCSSWAWTLAVPSCLLHCLQHVCARIHGQMGLSQTPDPIVSPGPGLDLMVGPVAMA